MSLLRAKLKRVPTSPGAYLMKGANGEIIYVGKAKNLKARLSSYFTRAHIEEAKTRALVAEIVDFEIMMVATEVEALLLERTLIKEHKPRYNVILRDDKEYPYVRVDFNEAWPRIRKVRRRKDDGATYLGPFSYVSQLNTILDLAYRIFPLIRCTPREFAQRSRPCNYYYMKRCLGPCVLEVDAKAYKGMLNDVLDFLRGKKREVVDDLKEKMLAAADAEDFEAAVRYREQINAIKSLSQEQNVVVKNCKNSDVIDFVVENTCLSVHILQIREGHITGQENFVLDLPTHNLGEALMQFLLQFYECRYIPGEIIIPQRIDDQEQLAALFTRSAGGKQVLLTVPERGQKKKLCAMAKKNAQYYLDEASESASTSIAALQKLKALFGLRQIPVRIDCIDISNIQGTAIVGSKVTFVKGSPAKDLYRLYNVKDFGKAPDDYEAMRLVCRRYFRQLSEALKHPQLVMLDGGKGHLNAVSAVLEEFPELKLKVELLAIAKDRSTYLGDDVARQSSERVFLVGSEQAVSLPPHSAEYRLLTQLRDEAHRFAITQHRRRRKKVLYSSELDSIPGIGPITRKKILKVTGVEELSQMSVEEISNLPGLSSRQAQQIFRYFKNRSA